MAVRREVVSLSQLLQRRNMGTSSNDRGPPPIVRPATPLVARASAGAAIPGRSETVTRPPPLRSVASKPPVQRVRSAYDGHAQSQQDSSYQSQTAHSVYSLSQEATEDSYMSLSQPPYSQSQPYFTPSQEEPRGLNARVATPTVQQSKYFQMLRESGKTSRKHAERGELQDDTIEKLLNPIKKTIDDISSALERQQDDQRRHKNESIEMKDRIEGLAAAVDKLCKQHRESEDDRAEARARETTKVASALNDVQYSLKKMQDRMASFTDFAVRFAEQERVTNRAVLAAMAGLHDTDEPTLQQRARTTGKRKAAASPAVVQLPRKRNRSRRVVVAPSRDSITSTPARSDVIWVDSDSDSDRGDNSVDACEEDDDDGLQFALMKLQDARTRRYRR